jgi:RNA polymerase sigma factor (TIGR02999 family)
MKAHMPTDVTQMLAAIERGDHHVAEELLPLVYQELRNLAAGRMANEAAGHTLQPTALVHEAWLRLVGSEQRTWQNRAHFFGAAAEAMRRILIESARRKKAQRRGGGQQPLDIQEIDPPILGPSEDLLAINDALEKFAAVEPQKAELVKLRYFVGLNFEECAEISGISVQTAKRWWAYARAWLFAELSHSE